MFSTLRVRRLVSLSLFLTLALTAFAVVPTSAQSKPSGTITVWGWQATQDSIFKTGVLQDFNAAYPDIKVNWVVYAPGDVYQKLPLALSAGTGAPDVSVVEDSHLAQFVYLGGLSDLTDKAKPYVDKILPYKWTQGTKDGKNYSIPWDSGPVVLFYRRDVFKKAGLKDDPDSVSAAVATWDNYLTTCQTIKDKTGFLCFPSNKANNDARIYEMMLWQQGLGYTDGNGKVTVDSAGNVATLEELGKFWKAGLLSDQQPWMQGWYDDFASLTKPVASLPEAAWMGVFLKSWIAPGTAGQWGVAQMPAMKAGQARTANDGGSSFVIPDQSQNKDAAWAFVEFVATHAQEQNKIFAYSDFFPSLPAAYDDALYIEPDTFFGGEPTRQLYVQEVKLIPQAFVYGQYYSEQNGYVATAIQKFATGKMSAADALKEAATAIRQKENLN